MAVLSLLARTPSPEPVDKDFYSEFGGKNTGKIIPNIVIIGATDTIYHTF